MSLAYAVLLRQTQQPIQPNPDCNGTPAYRQAGFFPLIPKGGM